MKRIIQLTLFLFLLLISAIFYQIYFGGEKEVIPQSVNNDEKISIQGENNLIENLKYEVRLDQDNQYIITSDLSEITYDNDIELVSMQNVVAIFIDKNNIPTIISSDKALYNNFNYNTNFEENVKIEYLDNLILADRMDIDFIKDTINIHENITYEGAEGTIKTDNIKIDLITKKIDIYMDNKKDNVEVKTNK